MSFHKPIDFLLLEPSVALPIKQALREAVALKVSTSDVLKNSGASCSEYVVCAKAQSGLLDARRKGAQTTPNEATEHIASFHGV
jgi:hypothetical protein